MVVSDEAYITVALSNVLVSFKKKTFLKQLDEIDELVQAPGL